MAEKSIIISAEEEAILLKPIDEYVGKIQEQIDALRVEGSDKVNSLKNQIAIAKENKNLTKEEQNKIIGECKKNLEKAKATEDANKQQIAKLIADAEGFLSKHYNSEYYNIVAKSCEAEKKAENSNFEKLKADLQEEHKKAVSSLKDAEEIKAEKYTYKNKLYDAQMTHESRIQEIKDRKHDAYMHKFHLIDLLRMSKYTFAQKQAQNFENYKYTFNMTQFLYKNGLYIVIIMIFIALCIMVGMGMVTATIIMHNGINTGTVFGHVFDFSGMAPASRAILALCVCILFTTVFAMTAGFFMARFKMHPFISTMANMLIIFGLVTYATKGVSFGAIDPTIPNIFIPQAGRFPMIILWAVVAIAVVWFIWNKTTFGKNLYAVGGNPEAAAVSGISVFKVTMGAFILAGILYGFGSWLECVRMVGSGSAAYGQGWDMDAIAACVVGGVSFTGGIGNMYRRNNK